MLPDTGTVLEVASGTGQHAAHFAENLPSLTFQPSDLDPANHVSIGAWTGDLGNVEPPLAIDVRSDDWGIAAADAIYCANMIHIAPWACAEGLVAGAGRVLSAGGPLALYGPFKRGGVHTVPSNEAFDASLRRQDPEWGVRDLEALAALGQDHGVIFEEAVDMPANNLVVILRRR